MYHSRTKKVTSYGRRAQRVVAVSDDRRFGADAFSVSSDREENGLAQHGTSDTSDDVFERPRKNAPFKPRSPNGKVTQRPRETWTPKKPIGKKTYAKDAPIRKPLGSRPPNIPKSPAASPKAHKARAGNSKTILLGVRRVPTTSPPVDVDIIVLDNDGSQLDKQHRVTRNVPSGDTHLMHVRRPRRSTAVKSYAIYISDEGGNDNDDEGDNDDEYHPSPGPVSKAVRNDVRKPVEKNVLSKGGRSTQKEALIPEGSESSPLRKPKASRRAVQTIVLTDSDSSSDHEESKRKVSRGIAAKRGSNIRTSRTPKTSPAPKLVSPSSTHHASVASDGACALNASLPRSGRVAQHVRPDRRDRHAMVLDSPAVKEQAQESRRPHKPPKAGPDVSQEQPRQAVHQSASHTGTGRPQQRTIRMCSSPRLIAMPDDDLSLSMDEELEMALRVAELQMEGSKLESASKSLVDELCAKEPVVLATARGAPPPRIASQRPRIPAFLRPLLSECGQLALFDFVSFIDSFPADPIIGFSGHSTLPYKSGSLASFDSYQKVGEASYSEVFGIGNVVLKIIPLFDEDHDVSETWTASWDPPPVSEVRDVLKEIVVTRAMGEICKGFIKLLKAHVVQGPYPQSLLTLWDDFHSEKGSESVRPDHFTAKQTYAVVILPNGGPDLENFSFGSLNLMGGSGWRQACSIFWQVVRSLGNAEDLVHFEHRDLHWGQILVRGTMRSSTITVPGSFGKVMLDDPWHGVQSTIIDLGLSRIDHGHGDSFWTPFDDEIFEGRGDYQYDIYRMMRHHNKGEWPSFKPLSNIMWLHYLTDKLIHHKHLRTPPGIKLKHNSKGAQGGAQLAILEADRRAYDCLVELEGMLGHSVAKVARSVGAKSFKTPRYSEDYAKSEVRETKSAGDVLRFGRERGWIM